MRAELQDLDNLTATLRSERAANLAARRAAWRDMTPRQRRRLTEAAIREFETWLAEHQSERGSRGRAQLA